jgi:hypothetical protein
MRKRPISIAGLAAIATTAVIASVAVAGPVVTGKDGNTQSIDVLISPKKLSKTQLTPASLKVTTRTTTTTAPNGVPSPAVQATVDFDKNAKLFTKGIPTCSASKLQNTSTEAALQACGSAKVGSGKATVLLPVGPQVYTEPTTVTAFNGAPQGGKPVVLLHVYGQSPVQTTAILAGAVLNLNKEGFGPRLDLEVPLIAGGTGALTEFQVTINKKYRYKGKQRSFVSAKCTSGKLKARGAFTFKDGETLTAFSTQTCKKKK